MTNDNENFEDDDIVIEGSDLHKALTDMGCTDFECTPIHRSMIFDVDEVDKSKDTSSTIKQKWLWNFIGKIKNCLSLYKSGKKNCGATQLEIISQLDPLLDDHSVMIQNMLKDNSSSLRERYIFGCSVLIVSNSILATTTLFYKPMRIPGLIIIPSIVTLIVYRTYSKLHSIKNLKELVSTQNDLYYLYKRTLKILKNSYCLKLSQRHVQKKFSNLNIERIKYLQSMCEYFIQSMEEITFKCYQISLLLINLLSQTCKNICRDNLMTKFEDKTVNINGEITYEDLKQHYYIYILVQSEMMQIFSILYQNIDNREINLKLINIVNSLIKLFKKNKIKLNDIIEQYKSSKTPIIRRELKNRSGIKLQDLYVHVDLLARKIQSAFNVVDSIIDDIESCTNDDRSVEIIDSIIEKMNETYKEIDTARNFAEFNNLLVGKFRQDRTLTNDNKLNSTINDRIEQVLPIVYDTDPEIIDEVFEEYIKDEYLKPLYEDSDIDPLERNISDKLLAKNFMSELKEVLIDKYKTMSEREARALLSYRKKNYNTNQDNENEVPLIPPPPPLPQSIIEETSSYHKQTKIRAPVPLPRSINATFSPTAQSRQKKERDVEPEILKSNEHFLMNININKNINKIQLPPFTINEETFIGSGENSDEEIIIDSDTN